MTSYARKKDLNKSDLTIFRDMLNSVPTEFMIKEKGNQYRNITDSELFSIISDDNLIETKPVYHPVMITPTEDRVGSEVCDYVVMKRVRLDRGWRVEKLTLGLNASEANAQLSSLTGRNSTDDIFLSLPVDKANLREVRDYMCSRKYTEIQSSFPPGKSLTLLFKENDVNSFEGIVETDRVNFIKHLPWLLTLSNPEKALIYSEKDNILNGPISVNDFNIASLNLDNKDMIMSVIAEIDGRELKSKGKINVQELETYLLKNKKNETLRITALYYVHEGKNNINLNSLTGDSLKLFSLVIKSSRELLSEIVYSKF